MPKTSTSAKNLKMDREKQVISGWTLLEADEPTTIKDLCEAKGLPYSNGCGCYELVKTEKVSSGKLLVAKNTATGETVEGGDAVRELLKLPKGSSNISTTAVKAPWRLFVNSTSPNRAIPAGSAVLIRSAAPASKANSSAKKRARDDSDEKEEEDDNDEDEDEDEDTSYTCNLEGFKKRHGKKAFMARGLSVFLKHAKAFRFTTDGGKWIVVTLRDNDDLFRTWESIGEWPRAFVGDEAQLVSGALYEDREDAAPALVGVCTFSTTGDETSIYYLANFDDMDLLEQLAEWNNNWEVSSGDYDAEHLHCPALGSVTSEAQFTFSSTDAEQDAPVRRAHRGHRAECHSGPH